MNKTKKKLSPEEQLEARKTQLLQDRKNYEQGIQEGLVGLKGGFQKSLRIGLVMAGVALGGYFVLRSLGKDKKIPIDESSQDKTLHTPVYQKVQENSVFAMIKREIALFLIAIAKQKILEMIAAFAENTEEAEAEAEAINPDSKDA